MRAHPVRPEVVAFARRPGRFALVLDCATGTVTARLDAVPGSAFSGHGTFSADGTVLYTAECVLGTSEGRVGVWRRADWARLGDFETGGIGPHEMLRLPGTGILVVANGGIHTDTDDDRTPLNLDTMQPSLAYLSPEGAPLELVELAPELRQNSIRHLAATLDGQVAFAMQWQGDPAEAVPLLGLHRRGTAPVLASAPESEQRAMLGYAGSVAFGPDGSRVGITSAKGGQLHLFDPEGGFAAVLPRADVCGLANAGGALVATDGLGGILRVGGSGFVPIGRRPRAWDNHIVAL